MNKNKKFSSFLESLKTEDNTSLIENIEKGFKACFESYRTFDSEFDTSKYTLDDYFTQSDEWEEDMWHNNVCPAFEHKGTGLKVWIEADDEEDRESPGSDKYLVQQMDEDGEIDYTNGEDFSTESPEELAQYLRSKGIKV